jgi:hypothetical protein
MSDEEFLARWSRRKREARAVVDAPPPEQAEAPNSPPPATAAHPKDVEVDLSSLPSIESITGATDITAFLRRGIPPELSRAALRRAWAADPAIRDFVGLAENAWDFNDPHAMPGFGPIDYSQDQLAGLVDRILGGVRQAADTVATAVTDAQEASASIESRPEPVSASRAPQTIAELGIGEEISTRESPVVPAAAQPYPSVNEANEEATIPRRTHGSALPR